MTAETPFRDLNSGGSGMWATAKPNRSWRGQPSTYLFVGVCARARERVCACVYECVCVSMREKAPGNDNLES